MDSGRRLIFDPSSAPAHHGQMLFLGGSGSSILRGGGLGLEVGPGKRRPFFTSHEELFDEDYYDELQLPEKKRRLTPEQARLLERSFEEENKLEPERKGELARRLGLQPRQVAVWFQNRRARWKTKQLELDFSRLKAAYDSLLADRDSLFEVNHRLRSQVATLTEKLQADGPAAIVGPTSEPAAGGEGSGVVDGSSGDSAFFLESFSGNGCGTLGPADDDGSDNNGGNYLPAAAGGMFEDQGNDHAADNWWGVWN